ncbi:hypothetical protein LZ554_004323 [Drepanopeziza brunnea f. sp. 'monogermtubi']|nr:hypothetical protein LZ554_004323 [Drepanopeziza brunnea f. sp. 'monogermtubi']
MGTSFETTQAAPVAEHSPERSYSKKKPSISVVPADDIPTERFEHKLSVTEDDLLQAQAAAKELDLEKTRAIMVNVLKMHGNDPNFPLTIVERIREFLSNDDILNNPEKHMDIIQEMKTEAALITNNSPYAEVRAVVDNTDDPNMLSSTIRAWVIGLTFVVILATTNQMFSIRQPCISVTSNVAQLVSFPLGKAAEAWLPDVGFTLFGIRHSLNPGKFTRKEHMLITIMANVSWQTPYTELIIWTQVLPQFFHQTYARGFVYQVLITFGTNFLGYSIAGIAPTNKTLNAITGSNNGLGFNPWPSFDWNPLLFDNQDPFMVPFFNTLNKFVGQLISGSVIIYVYFTNKWYTSYIPINTNRVWDNMGKRYNVSKTIDAKGIFDPVKYQAYSPAYLGASNLMVYLFYFAVYSSAISYCALYHRFEIKMGFRNLFNSFRKDRKENKDEYQDIHNKLMSAYPEVSELWYLCCLLFAISLSIAGIVGYHTYTTVGVVFFGIALCLLFVVPLGIVAAMTGIEVTLNVLAEFIGGSIVPGNALAMNFFKSYGYVTCAHAIRFSNDLKLAHYVKIPPRHTFSAQMVATFISTFICIGVLNFQIREIPDVCEPDQKNRFTCPGPNKFFTASILWGTLGPQKMFGKNGQYCALLMGFPIGLVLPVIVYYAQKKFPRQEWLRQVHPVVMMYGSLAYAPYNLTNVWPAVPLGWFSMVWLKKRYLGFWSKYNYIVSASWSSAIAIAAVIIFFALQWSDRDIVWWGNTPGCLTLRISSYTLHLLSAARENLPRSLGGAAEQRHVSANAKEAVGFAMQALEAILSRDLPVPTNADFRRPKNITGNLTSGLRWREISEKTVMFSGAGRGWEGLPE